ncbi:recombinase family protein [Streptomyces griseorubiginosus]|uniref:recombinase family protein n=1 Tax=Streptomyces griseorubiginosus TaxID=67304 RepID=UPI0036BD259C
MPVANQATEPAPLMRAALMLRVSTREQAQGYGLDVQEHAGRAYIDRQPGWRLSPELIFRDEGVSGAVVERPGMLRLEQAALQGLVDVVVVHKFDRIGRTGRALWTWIWAMEDLGVRCVSVTQDADASTPSGQQQLHSHATMAEEESGLIRERTQGGRQRKALQAGWIGGPPPWGYAIDGIGVRGSVLLVDEGEARVVRKAVSLLVDEGMNVGQAARALNELGYPTRSGRPWSASNLHRRLKSSALLKCEVVFRKPDGGGKSRTKLGQDGAPLHGESVVIPLPRLITEARAEALEQSLMRNAHSSHAAGRDYPLTGRIVGTCGHRYVGSFRNVDGIRYYRCGGNNNGKGVQTGCTDPYLTAADVEAVVRSRVGRLLADDGCLAAAGEGRVVPVPGDAERQRVRVAVFEKSFRESEETAARAVVDLARHPGLGQGVKDAALKQLNEEVRLAGELLAIAREVLASHEEAEVKARRIEHLAVIAREGASALSFTEMREAVDFLDITVKPLGTVRKRSGVACRVTEWHERTGTPVPAAVGESEWAAVEKLMVEFFGRRPYVRGAVGLPTQLNGILHRLRTGCLWDELPECYGPWAAVKDRQNSWFRKGFWLVLTCHLNRRGGGTPVQRELRVPPLEVTSGAPSKFKHDALSTL